VKIDLLICCGDFQAVRNIDDLECMSVPNKYKELGTFWKYYSGEALAPYPTLFIGGNHEASNYLWELYYGGWVCPNIYYIGHSGVINFGELRIGGLSGIFKARFAHSPSITPLRPANSPNITPFSRADSPNITPWVLPAHPISRPRSRQLTRHHAAYWALIEGGRLPQGALRAPPVQGRAVQVDPIKPKLKPPETEPLKLKCDVQLSTSAFKFNLRRHNEGHEVKTAYHVREFDVHKLKQVGSHCLLIVYPAGCDCLLTVYPPGSDCVLIVCPAGSDCLLRVYLCTSSSSCGVRHLRPRVSDPTLTRYYATRSRQLAQ
jgi:hypothetical protein